jgi:hypothetical protein
MRRPAAFLSTLRQYFAGAIVLECSTRAHVHHFDDCLKYCRRRYLLETTSTNDRCQVVTIAPISVVDHSCQDIKLHHTRRRRSRRRRRGARRRWTRRLVTRGANNPHDFMFWRIRKYPIPGGGTTCHSSDETDASAPTLFRRPVGGW